MAPSRYGRLAALATLMLLFTGCDLMSLPYFLSGADSRRPPALMSLAPDAKEKGKRNRVLVMAYCGLVADPQLVTADREVTRRVIGSLHEALQQDKDKDKVTFVAASQIDRYKDAHPDWHINLVDAGKHFHADYVVYLDLQTMSLFESKSYNQFLHAQADVQVKVIDMRSPDDPKKEREFRCEYPTTGPELAEDRRLEEFRNSFYQEIATRVCWLFAAHEPTHLTMGGQ